MRPMLFLVLMVASACGLAQSPDTLRPPPRDWLKDELTLLTGYHQGRFAFAELGIGRSIHGVVRHPFGIGYHIGAEARVDRPSLIGWKVGGYMTAGFAMGAQVIRYQEGREGCTVLRPEVGIGILKAKVTYAYNINLSPSRVPGINAHMVSIAYAWRVALLQRT
ncbi:MAG: hypothetical protein IPM46_02245 [Flavobacteriales bacterium]|nr:hypothetical protein [Flavobacteriales bacterium]